MPCSFSSVLYKHVFGDKDTFGFAFALAGKLHELYFVATPPGAAFKDEVRGKAPASGCFVLDPILPNVLEGASKNNSWAKPTGRKRGCVPSEHCCAGSASGA